MPSAPLANTNANGPRTAIRTATGQAIASTATATLAHTTLPPEARTGHIMPTCTNNLLILGKLCDAGCYAFLNQHALHVYNAAHDLVLRGDRETSGARLWRVDLRQGPALQPHPLLPQPLTAALSQHAPMLMTRHTDRNLGPAIVEDDVDACTLRRAPLQTPRPRPPPAPAPHDHQATIPTTPPAPTPTSRVPPKSTPSSTHTHKRAYDLPSTRALIEYLHATAGYPVKSSWLNAIKRGYYHSWPGLTYATAARYCPTPDETIKGHLAQSRKHVRSTTATPTLATAPDTILNALDPMADPNAIDVLEIPLNKIFTDDTGRFPIRARSGHQYLMVAFHQRSNAILIRPFASKADAHRIPTYNAIMTKLATSGQVVNLHILDNEASAAYRAAITANGCTYQLVPPHVHRRNAAERAIRTFKEHFLAILAGVDPSFPASRWDLLLPQAELTLNLLRPCRYNPTVSAWEGLNGYFKFDATPMGPPGSRIIIHAKPELRKSWDYRGQDGYFVGPALNHYRCYTVLKKDSQAVIISDTVRFRHHTLTIPDLSAEDKIIHALQTLTHSMTGAPTASTDDQLMAIASLRDIFRNYAKAAPPPTHPDAPPQPLPRVGSTAPTRADPTDTQRPQLPRVIAPPTEGWSVVSTRRNPTATPTGPVATRTRSRLTDATRNAFAALTDDGEDTNLALPVLDHDTGKTLEHRQLRRHPKYKEIWDTSYANELGRLCQGIGSKPSSANPAASPPHQRVEGTDTFRPIQHAEIPPERRHDVTYTRVVCEVRPQKAEPNRTCITIGGNRICYPGDCGTKTGSIELVKTLLNSTVSRKGARFACFDISNFYLGTPLDRPEYVRIKLTDIPQEFIDEYNLTKYAHNGWVYFEITKGVYGLKQAGKLANDLLTSRLETHGYYQCTTTPGLWRHKWRPIVFVLIVDDFGIEYVNRRHAEHLLAALQETYKVTTDWTGSKFAGIDIAWDYTKRTCRITMNGYIANVLLKYNHQTPRKPQHSPHQHREIIYGAKQQLIPDDDTSPVLDADGIKRIQGIVGSLLYYARAVDNKLLVALSAISSKQATATVNTAKAVSQLLDYVATYPSDGITYRASSMILAAHSDASFLTEPGSRSRAGAFIFLSENDPIPRINGPILTMATIIKFVMASASESELAALYLTAREMIPLRNALDEMGWPQPKSPIQTDNSTAAGFVNDTIIQRRIKMLWMRLHWLRCRAAQGQFRFYWDKGNTNLADYSTKHHPPAYHLAHRPTHAG